MECGMMGTSMYLSKKLYCWAVYKDAKTIGILTHEFPLAQKWWGQTISRVQLRSEVERIRSTISLMVFSELSKIVKWFWKKTVESGIIIWKSKYVMLAGSFNLLRLLPSNVIIVRTDIKTSSSIHLRKLVRLRSRFLVIVWASPKQSFRVRLFWFKLAVGYANVCHANDSYEVHSPFSL